MNDDPLSAELARKYQLYTKRVAIINGLMCSVGVLLAAYVYLRYPHPDQIVRTDLDKFGQPIRPDTIEEYLFVFPTFQVWCFLMPLWAASKACQNLIERSIKEPGVLMSRRPPVQDALLAYQFTFGGLVAIELFLFVAAVYHSLKVAMKFV